MKKKLLSLFLFFQACILAVSCGSGSGGSSETSSRTIDHTCIDISRVPEYYLNAARANLHIAYGHTSHGSQLIEGMTGLITFMGTNGALYDFNNGGTGGALDIRDFYGNFGGFTANDLGNPDFTAWESATRNYLDLNNDINVIIWSWCGQVSHASESDISGYLSLMSGLEKDFPGVVFVYMTGHLDGSGLTGNLHLRNNQIREYCRANNRFLFDFEDIESYNPDGIYFGDKNPNDACEYDSDGNGTIKNWAIDWQNSHTEGAGFDWYNCGSAHSQPLNANMKAYAAWWLWAKIAGWN